MAFALRSFFLLCGVSGLLTGVWSFQIIESKGNDCPKDWTQLDCHCYIYQPDIRAFADAEAVCNILDANLVSIHSDLENALVVHLIRAGGNDDVAWIGLNDAIEDDDFIWTDGSQQDFLNFDTGSHPGEPDQTGNCVAIDEDDGFWQDDLCTDEEPFVCIRNVNTFHH
ncbi:lectin-like [Vanacampus margaritifer]